MGDPILNEITSLYFILPENAHITEVIPQPSEQTSSGKNTIIGWKNTVLANMVLEFEVEQTLEEEVFDFFNNIKTQLFLMLQTKEGIALATLVVLFVSGYLYLLSKKGV